MTFEERQQIETWQEREEREVSTAVDALSRLANVSTVPSVFVERMSREHRTLQQGMTSLMLSWFAYLAQLPPSHYDARNEASVKLARIIMHATGGISRLPLI